MTTIYELRKNGLKIKIRHKRRYQVKIPQWALEDIYVTKGEMKFDNDRYIENQIDDARASIEFKLNNNGGVTQLSILNQNNELLGYGESICSEKDNFNKKLAISIALGRALKEAYKNGVVI